MGKNSATILLIISATVAFSVGGCYYDKEQLLYPPSAANSCDSINAKFAVSVLPLIEEKCATTGCHDAASAAGNTVLTTYADIAAHASLINQWAIVDKTMPLTGPLSPAQIAILNCWISSGSPNN